MNDRTEVGAIVQSKPLLFAAGALVLLGVLLWGLGVFKPDEAHTSSATEHGGDHDPEDPMLVGRPGPDLPGAESTAAGGPEVVDLPHLRSVRIRVTRAGEGAPGVTVLAQGNEEATWDRRIRRLTDADGRVVIKLFPGSYFLDVTPRPGHTEVHPFAKARRRAMHSNARLARVRVEVAADRDPDPIVVELSGTQIDATVTEQGGRPLQGATLRVIRLDEGHRNDLITGGSAPTDERGEASVLDLPFGIYEVHAFTDWHVLPEPVRVKLTEDDPEHRLRFELAPAGTIHLEFEDPDGEIVAISAAFDPTAVHLETRKQYKPTSARQPRGKRPHHLLFQRVPVGEFDVMALDGRHVEIDARFPEQQIERRIRFQPIDRAYTRKVRVRAGEITKVTVPIVYRAYVTLAGHTQKGAFDRSLVMRIWWQDPKRTHRERVLPAPWQRGEYHGGHHFEGYLLPGIYDVELKRKDGRTWTERLVVERDNIDTAYRAPWPD